MSCVLVLFVAIGVAVVLLELVLPPLGLPLSLLFYPKGAML
jgi:hypothetical protein